MRGRFKHLLWTALNSQGLLDELHFAVALGSGISAYLFAQPTYFNIENFRKILAETDARHLEYNHVPLVDLIKIRENRDGWLQKADVWVDGDVLAHFRDQMPSALWVYFPVHEDTVCNVKVLWEG